MRAALVAAILALVLAACGAGAAPAAPGGIQATPAVQRTTLPSLTPEGQYQGY